MVAPQVKVAPAVVPWVNDLTNVCTAKENPSSIAIIVPVLNEREQLLANVTYFKSLERQIQELIFVDGGSKDGTLLLLQENGFRVVSSEMGRATQMNTGAFMSKADILLFLHVDTRLPENFKTLIKSLKQNRWGFFRVKLSHPGLCYRIIARGINFRSLLFKVGTGDQAIFVERSLFETVGGYANIALMEDVDISRRLKKIGPPNFLKDAVITSSRRWEKYGPIFLTLKMWSIQVAFKLGVSPDTLRRWYA